MNARVKPNHRSEIEEETERVYGTVMETLQDERAVVIVRAPPGSGKTYLLSRVVQALSKAKRRVVIAAQTNAQADDICRRLSEPPFKLSAYRFVRSDAGMDEAVHDVTAVSSFDDLPRGPCIVVGISAKWGFTQIKQPFDVLLVDEAWQMQWSQFVPLGRIASRFVLIGDPGQIPPVVAVDSSRWETTHIPPHLPAPEIICAEPAVAKDVHPIQLRLPASRRLPADAVSILQPFYDFEFKAWALPDERAVLTARGGKEPVDRAIDLLTNGSVAAVTNPTVDDLPPSDMDNDVADLAVRIAVRLLERKASVRLHDGDEKADRKLTPSDIAMVATHRVMNELLERRVRRSASLNGIRVDTPERWQGLQRLITIAVHPLSGVLRPSSFDLETGRLCVMASRHQGGLLVTARNPRPTDAVIA